MSPEDSKEDEAGSPDKVGPSAARFEARIEASLRDLSTDVRELQRKREETNRAFAAAPPRVTPTSWGTLLPVILLCVLIVVLIGGLGFVMRESHADFAKGIAIADAGSHAGQNPSAMARRVFLLACGNQIFTFKATAFVISALMFFVGAVFVLLKAETPYALSTEGNGLKASLSTSSPGLVIVTLSVALAIATLYAKSNLADQPDTDLIAPAASASAKPDTANSEAEFARNLERYRLRSVAAAASATPNEQQVKP